MDPSLRSLLPIGLVGLVGFMLFCLDHALSIAIDYGRLLYSGERIEAELFAPPVSTDWALVRNGLSARYVDAQGAIGQLAPPKDVTLVAGQRFTVLREGDSLATPERAWINVGIATGILLFGLIPFFVAKNAGAQLLLDRRRIARLRRANWKVQPISTRVAREKAPRRRGRVRPDWYRVWALFEYGGRLYEAPGELQAGDPGRPDPGLCVNVDPADPLQSMILGLTLADFVRLIRG